MTGRAKGNRVAHQLDQSLNLDFLHTQSRDLKELKSCITWSKHDKHRFRAAAPTWTLGAGAGRPEYALPAPPASAATQELFPSSPAHFT